MISRNNKKIVFGFLLIAFFCFAADEILAQCACSATYRDITAHNEFKLADAVFVGKVIEIKKTPRDKDSYIEVVKFEVTRAWKHDLETNLTITNTVQGCLNGFEEKEEWLVYAYRHLDGTLGTYCCCTRTKPLSRALGDLKEFEDKGEKPMRILNRQDRKPTTSRTKPCSCRRDSMFLK
jgi:hypothetical protein